MEKLKYQFHLLLHILSYKNINNQNKYSIITQISLTESLMWKIKGRSFPVLNEIMKVFEDIKNINNEQNLFIFENNNIYNINYYNKRKLIEIKFEVFKILVSQIIDKIKEILIFKKENKNKLSIERDPSNISNDDFKNICIIIFSYFTDIKQESLLYYEIILFFYKIFINSDMMINFILEKYPKVISKIINIALNINELNIKNKNENYINNREQNNRLIMIKLLCKILENINNENVEDLLDSINIKNYESPLLYLSEKLLDIIINNKNNIEIIIYKYYIKLLLIIINKTIELKGDEKIIKQINKYNIDNIDILNMFILSDSIPYISENQFIIKKKDSFIFEEVSLFNSISNEFENVGTIICFLNYGKESDINNYLKNDLIYHFDESLFIDSATLKNDYISIIAIKNYYEQFSINDISIVDIKKIQDIYIIKNENKNKMIFIENYKKIIMNKIKEKILQDSLNEKGIYYLLKLLYILIDSKKIEENDIIYIFKYLWDYYYKNSSKENNYIFMSLEFLEKILNKYFQIYRTKTIYKENEDNNKTLYSLFKYEIKNNTLKIFFQG